MKRECNKRLATLEISLFFNLSGYWTFILNFIFIFLDRILLCSPDWLGTKYVDQNGLKLTKVCLILHLQCWG